ncbi:hypothetical protein K3U93_18945 [Mycobacterium malmoense]|uniref:hypothetical protein n=1 Tax=Mycobacterium malmoense TaxID=1780 RepID=UPI00111C2762|nr:hypothetical protein [Mycobacterium malmoense]QZA16705.1 hypothetical protein K3U93_18945 [Mycobacterium malmoense]UNB93502.1 hypothetical protein H5T25_18925 [Mycobacterium malmoense]
MALIAFTAKLLRQRIFADTKLMVHILGRPGQLHEPEVVPGKCREHDVSADRYLASRWQDVPKLVDRFVRWLVLRSTSASRAINDGPFLAKGAIAVDGHRLASATSSGLRAIRGAG